MSNDCNNKLVVSGEPDVVTEFIDAVVGDEPVENVIYVELEEGYRFETALPPIDLDKIVPRPYQLEGRELADWASVNWGTLKIRSFAPPAVEAGKVTYIFSSAWTPPARAIAAAARAWPDLRFELIYEEPNMGFCGRQVREGGRLVEGFRAQGELRQGVSHEGAEPGDYGFALRVDRPGESVRTWLSSDEASCFGWLVELHEAMASA